VTNPHRTHGFRNALLLALATVFALRLGLHAFARVLDVVWVVLVVLATVVIVGSRSSRR
jgi:hypothetical protein